MKLILLGAPGAGKGTLANLLKQKLDVAHISTGDILREEMKNNSPLGQKVKGFMDKGQLVPDEVVTEIIEHRFLTDKKVARGYLLDGFPRTLAQAHELDKILARMNNPIDYVLYLEVALETVIKRLTGRRVCKKCGALFHIVNRTPKKAGVCDECGGALYQRQDDNEETIKTRMDVYIRNLMPMIEYYRAQKKLKTLNADQESEEVLESLITTFNEDRKFDKH